MGRRPKSKLINGDGFKVRYIVALFTEGTAYGFPMVFDATGEISWGGKEERYYIPSFSKMSDARVFKNRAVRKLQPTCPSKLRYKTMKIGVIDY